MDPRFQKISLGNAGIRRIATGFDFTEGPVWFGDGRYLLFSDIPNDRILRWDETTGGISVFRSPSHYANGNTRDRQGRLITCEHDTQRLTRTEYDGTVVVLADRWEGKKLTGPNDVVVKSDGTIWFSDNGAGTRGNYLGHTAPQEHPFRVYRLDPFTGTMTIAVNDMARPNGLCFSPDESRLYVVDTPATGPKSTWVYDVVDKGTRAVDGRMFFDGDGWADGIRCDTEGNVLVRVLRWRRPGWGGGVRAGWNADRAGAAAGTMRECLLRGIEAEPVVHGGQSVGLCFVCGGSGRGWGVKMVLGAGHIWEKMAHRPVPA